MNYAEMSDFEIDRAVALHLGLNIKAHRVDSDDNPVFVIVGEKFTREKLAFQPCNSWADAGSIITENQISIIFDADPVIEPPAHWVMCRHVSDKGDITEHYGRPDSPLRAAMIVFLMMQEDK